MCLTWTDWVAFLSSGRHWQNGVSWETRRLNCWGGGWEGVGKVWLGGKHLKTPGPGWIGRQSGGS